ncbi:MAG: GNAT family N-acetyltransferase [Myxococcales bacterium]|nr:GNAT family N-acetyltransferase [Myxococcales bacterium]
MRSREDTRLSHEVLELEGDAIELTKQSLLLDLFAHLQPKEGEFWYLESDGSDVCLQAGPEAKRWGQAALQDEVPEALKELPLWRWVRPFLRSGFFLGARGMALRALHELSEGRVALRWVLGQRRVHEPVQWQAHLDAWLQSSEISRQQGPHRIMHLEGAVYETLQEMIYLGQARAPGVLLIEPEYPEEELSDLLSLLETALSRGFWVLCHLPIRAQDERMSISGATYDALYRGVQELQVSLWSVEVSESSSSFWQRAKRSAWWVMAPTEGLGAFREKAWSNLQTLFRLGFQRHPEGGGIKGLSEPLSMQCESDALESFMKSFPQDAGFQLFVDRARSSDMKAILDLWDALMDEHAKENPLFQRRATARYYLRRTFLNHLSQPGHLLLALRHRQSPVGFLSASVMRTPLLQENRFGQIIDTYIEPEWRGRGLGSEMVRCTLQWFRLQGIRQVELNVATHNQAGERFWERHGFSPYLAVATQKIDTEGGY